MNLSQALDPVVRANGRFAMVAFWAVVGAYTHFKYFT